MRLLVSVCPGEYSHISMLAYPHERFAVEVTVTPAMVAAYAAAGDTNPVHHDPTFAATTRYRR